MTWMFGATMHLGSQKNVWFVVCFAKMNDFNMNMMMYLLKMSLNDEINQ